jgi:hypothetical protein
MSKNLLETVQQNLGYPALQKINIETGMVNENTAGITENKFSQAAIPAVLTALYRYAQSDEGAALILKGDTNTDWTLQLFDANRKEAIQTISAYAAQSNENPVAKINAIADEAVKLIRERVPVQGDIKDVRTILADEKTSILLHLLPELHMGQLLNDNTLDDDTNKMQGPISSLINSIGEAFSTPAAKEEVDK